MSVWRERLYAIHRLCVNQLFYPLLLSSLLACALYTGRVYLSRYTTFSFLLWNLFLAWIPYVCSLCITLVHARRPRQWWLLILPGLLWLIFLPNAPYIVTDIIHLTQVTTFPQWYDIGMFATFAWTGCFIGVVSLNQIHRVVRRFSGWLVSWLFVLGVAGLTGFAIFLGRFHSMNSWDLFVRPESFFAFMANRLAHPLGDRNAIGVPLLFGAFMLICYFTFVSIEHRRVESEIGK